jgi:hypothetical protein
MLGNGASRYVITAIQNKNQKKSAIKKKKKNLEKSEGGKKERVCITTDNLECVHAMEE